MEATVSSRGLAYIDIAFYECAAISSPRHVSMSGQLTGFVLPAKLIQKKNKEEYSAPAAANIAMYKVSMEMFRSVFSRTLRNVVLHADSTDAYFQYKLEPETYKKSIEIGTTIAEEIITWAKKDGGHEAIIQAFDVYHKNKMDCDSCWVFHERSLKAGGPVTPSWGKNRLFVKDNESLNISPAIAFSSDEKSPFYKQAIETYENGRATSNSFYTLTEKEKLADFWNDASNLDDAYTPATHSHSLLLQCFEKNLRMDFASMAEIFARLGIGLSDAFVVAWKEKQEHFLIRPDTYIQRYIDKDWSPLIITPQFPEFPSGHTTQFGVFELIMSDFFGEEFAFKDNRMYRGGDRKFSSFHQAADQVVEARILGGIHFRFSCEQGRTLGNQLAKNVFKLKFINVNEK
jgi:hypothetical protein